MRRRRRLAEVRAEEQRFRELGVLLEQKARENSLWYELSLWLFCKLGCAFLVLFFAVLLGSLYVLGFLVYRYPIAPLILALLVVFCYAIYTLAFLCLRPIDEVCYPISERQAPGLCARVREIQQKIGAPCVHQIYITPWVGASCYFQPRFGIWGPRRNSLYLGLPLFARVTESEGDFVIAHELAHLRQRTIAVRSLGTLAYWSFVKDAMEAGDRNHPVCRFARWYVPRLAARTWARSRLAEFESDRIAADLVGAEAGATCLLKLTVLGTCADEALSAFWRRACDEPEPPKNVAEMLLERLAEISSDQAQASLEARLADPNDGDATHPSMRQRLQALGAEDLIANENLPTAAETAANKPEVSWAEKVFGENLDVWVSRASGAYYSAAYASWVENHRSYVYLLLVRERVLEESPLSREAEADERYLCYLSHDFRGEPEEALRCLQEAYDLTPESRRFAMVLGSELATRRDRRAIELLREAAKSPEYAEDAYRLLVQLFEELGEPVAADQCYAALHREQEVMRKALAELKARSLWSTYRAALLTPYERICWSDQLNNEKRALAAYCVELLPKVCPDRPLRVVVVEVDGGLFPGLFSEAIEEAVAERLYPYTRFVVASPRRKKLLHKLARIGVTAFWHRKKS